ncbi:MAG: hypothetical protein KGK01_15575 [Bradyrhizobium sp.]|uniref:hypothetical protein n=1 Tax=Bradyrhizobium sp. TaxID=376 RepID=UPI001C284833|nr:hypothetical protein [Bradyrhizobium sp.]MBU6464354.1 hypothetical protein [Pseudomonadota bacterium]MDE2065988.1 hypothetical protein [Bradyrhizobium sp.]MDE2243789.1 hypothetical protein [Bradyrhizobium sp.]MDE2470750.1 hypothetical protein [Bradyrhizobium sp.]
MGGRISSMIRKNRDRFSEKIMLKQEVAERHALTFWRHIRKPKSANQIANNALFSGDF